MQCPNCRAVVPDDVVVCPRCDAVVDPSLFDAQPGPPKPNPARSGAKRRGRKPGTSKAKRSDAGDWRSRVSAEDWRAGGPDQTGPDRPSEPGVDPLLGLEVAKYQPTFDDELLGDAKSFLKSLSRSDQVALWSAVGMAVACFFPWRETVAEGEVMGLLSHGVIVFVLAGVLLATIAIRTRRRRPNINPLVVWAAQMGAASLSALWILICLKLWWDPTLVRAPFGNDEMWVSKPSLGAIAGLFCALTSVVGTVLGLQEVSVR